MFFRLVHWLQHFATGLVLEPSLKLLPLPGVEETGATVKRVVGPVVSAPDGLTLSHPDCRTRIGKGTPPESHGGGRG